MFHCIGAAFTYLHGASLSSGPFWVRKLKKSDFRYDKDKNNRSIMNVEIVIRNQPFHRQNDSNFVRDTRTPPELGLSLWRALLVVGSPFALFFSGLSLEGSFVCGLSLCRALLSEGYLLSGLSLRKALL